MQTKTKINNNIQLPQEIQKSISERGFYLYEWISPDEVKMSIERDYLNILQTIGPVLAIISITGSVIIAYILENIFLAYIFFFWVVWIWIIWILCYLFIVAIFRSKILMNNSFVVVTDSSISVAWNIFQHSQTQDIAMKIYKVENIFNEKLFNKSELKSKTDNLFRKVCDLLFWGYSYITHFWSSEWRSYWSSRDSGSWFLFMYLLYTAYIILMFISFFIGVFILWLFSLWLTSINKKIWLIKWHEVTVINNLFTEIDERSNILFDEKKNVQKLLGQAYENDWKDSLLEKINKWIASINTQAVHTVENAKKLREKLHTSRYKKMFNIHLFNSWLKKQIYDPLFDLQKLLEKSIDTLQITRDNIWVQITETSDISLQSPLKLQEKRIDLQIVETTKNIRNIKEYLQKLI